MVVSITFDKHVYRFHYACITFFFSYLQGTALEYFELYIIDEIEEPDWMSHFSSFVELLQSEFGLTDSEGKAEKQLDVLKIYNNQKLLKYNVEFQCLAIRTSW